MALLLAGPAWTVRGVPFSAVDFAVLGTLMVLLVKGHFRWSLVLIAAAAWLLAMGLSLTTHASLGNALRIGRMAEVLGLLLMLSLRLGLTFDDVKWWVLGAGAISLMIGLVDFGTGRSLGASSSAHPLYLTLLHHIFLRPGGVFGDPAQLGTVAAIEILVALVSMFEGGIRTLIVCLAAIALGTIVILASGSRSSMLFLAAAIVVVLVLDQRRRQIEVLIVVGVVVSLAAILLLRPQLVSDFLLQRVQVGDLTTGRLARWSVIWNNFWATPSLWLTGIGYKAFTDNPANVLTVGYHDPYPYYSIDNNYLSALVETGVIGFGAMVAWIVAIARQIWQSHPSRLRMLAIACTIGLLAESVTVDALTFYRLVGFLVLLVVCISGSASAQDPHANNSLAMNSSDRLAPPAA